MNTFQSIGRLSLSSAAIPLLLLVSSAALTACGGGGGGGSTTTVSASKAPTASSSAVLTAEDNSVVGSLTASDPEEDPLTFNITSNGNLGTAVIVDPSQGTFTYTPDQDKNGTDNFTFQVSDGTSTSNSATVTITITPVGGDAPVAQADSLNTSEDTPLNGTLPAFDPDGDPLTYSLVGDATQGNVVITNTVTGAFTYTPSPNSSGSDSFTFKVSDSTLLESDIGTVTISVDPVNDPPTAIDGCGYTTQPTTSGALLYTGKLNATDIDSGLLMYSLADGSSGPFTTANGAEVTITDPTTGAFTYKAKSLAEGGNRGTDNFDYQVRDPDGAVSTATERVVVNQNIMPLGDSITVGDTDVNTSTLTTVGYRKPLNDSLNNAGIGFDFVGTQAHGTAVSGFDYDHEGHGGWTASELAWGGGPGADPADPNDGVYGWLSSNPSDFILLHAGTNGLSPSGDFDIEAILDEIDRWETNNGKLVTVLLALIIDQVPTHPDVTTFNQNVLTAANNRIAAGDDIIIIDQQNSAGLVYQIGVDMAEKLHPNANGYAKMSDTWLNTLTVVLDQCP